MTTQVISFQRAHSKRHAEHHERLVRVFEELSRPVPVYFVDASPNVTYDNVRPTDMPSEWEPE